MPKSREQKSQILEELSDKIGKAKSVVFAKTTGLEVKDNEALRKLLRAENGEFFVAKKTLFDIAFKKQNIEGLDGKKLEGQVAAIFSYGDEVSSAKIVDKFKKEHEGKIDFAGGVLENKFINASQVVELAKLPSKQELYAKLVGTINAPVSGFVNVLAGNIRSLVNVLNAVGEKK